MKITIRTQYVSDDNRRALWWSCNKYSGNPATCPMATREQYRGHLESVGHSEDDDLNDVWHRAIEDFTQKTN